MKNNFTDWDVLNNEDATPDELGLAALNALKNNDTAFLMLLKDNPKVNWNAQDKSGVTPIMLAASKIQGEMINEFIPDSVLKDTEILNTKDKDGQTALMYAIEANNVNLVKSLIDNGADFNIRDAQGRTAKQYAEALGYNNIADMIPESEISTLTEALEAREFKIAEKMIRDGVDIEQGNSNGSTPLMIAAAKNNLEAMDLLIRNGANVNAMNLSGVTVLMTAAETSIDAVKKIMKTGKVTDINAIGDSGTALTYAVNKGNVEVAKYLIQEGADPHTAGLIKNGDIIETITDNGLRDTLLGYIQAEQEFKEKFEIKIKEMVKAAKQEDMDFKTINNKINGIIDNVLKNEPENKFSNLVRQGQQLPTIKLAFIDKFILALKDILPDKLVENRLKAVIEEKLNLAIQKTNAFKPLSKELQTELKSFADRVKNDGQDKGGETLGR